MAHVLPFAEVLEAADRLSQDEQEELIAILHRRLAQAARQRLTGLSPRGPKTRGSGGQMRGEQLQ
jgi:hypothetical protein